ncbi:MAG: hypothetical protein O9292_15220 [Rhodobacteraceae bacterium]|jgi:hypothetical protein|nr:hypothetical protein [Paracoccaceae bacterium]MCZ8153728.1 hypothetical protein [Paracoccaceae bacterium]
MSLAYLSPGRRLAALGVLGLSALPLAAQAELRPAVLPEEICLVLANGPFDSDVAALIAGRDDFASILVQAEATCPELLGNLIGATATIPEPVSQSEGNGGRDIPVILPPDVVTIPTEEEPDPGTDPETPPPDGDGTGLDPLPDTDETFFESAPALL